MFNNIGNKLKTFAQVNAWMGIVASLLIGFIAIYDDPLLGLLIIIFGCFGSWISSFGIYGFGEIINLLQQNINNQEEILNNLKVMDKKGNTTILQDIEDNLPDM